MIEGDTHLSKWIEEQGKLDVDGSAHAVAKRFIKTGDVVVDGGACLGDHTKVYLDAVGPTGIVHAFEPNPAAFECLQLNCPKAVLHQEALGSASGWRGILLDPNVGATSLTKGYGNVKVALLDDYKLPRLNFFKLDVEGMEFEALCGSWVTLVRCQPVVMVEFNRPLLEKFGSSPEEISDFMFGLDYRMELLDPNYGLDIPHTDVLFLPA